MNTPTCVHRVPSGGSLGWTADVQERSPRLDAAQQLLGDFQQLASGGFQRLASDPSSLLGGVASLFHSPADSGDNRNEHAEPAQTSRPEDESACIGASHAVRTINGGAQKGKPELRRTVLSRAASSHSPIRTHSREGALEWSEEARDVRQALAASIQVII